MNVSDRQDRQTDSQNNKKQRKERKKEKKRNHDSQQPAHLSPEISHNCPVTHSLTTHLDSLLMLGLMILRFLLLEVAARKEGVAPCFGFFLISFFPIC